jgi:hypothetical protein
LRPVRRGLLDCSWFRARVGGWLRPEARTSAGWRHPQARPDPVGGSLARALGQRRIRELADPDGAQPGGNHGPEHIDGQVSTGGLEGVTLGLRYGWVRGALLERLN